MDFASLIKDLASNIVAAVGLGYFVYYVWNQQLNKLTHTLRTNVI